MNILVPLWLLIIAGSCLNAQTSWHSLAAPIRGVDVSDDGRVVVAVGDYGSILYSTDAGTSWQRDFADSYERFEDVLITSSGTFVIVGRGGFLGVRERNAEQWYPVSLDPYQVQVLHRVRQVGDIPHLVTVMADSLLLMVDLSGGKPVHLQTPQTGTPAASWFLSATEGFVAVSGAGLYRTTNAGEEWVEAVRDTGLTMPDIVGSEEGGLIALSSAEGWLYLSHDSGRTWARESVDAELSPTRVDLAGEYVGVGGVPAPRPPRHGIALFSISSNTWLWKTNVMGDVVTDIAIDSRGRARAANDLSSLVSFDSAGRSTYEHYPNPNKSQFSLLAGAPDSTAFVATQGTTVHRTVDRGTTWELAFAGWRISGIEFDDQGNGVLLLSDGRLTYRTIDTGSTFTPADLIYREVDSSFPVQKTIWDLSSFDREGRGYGLMAESVNPEGLYLLHTEDTLRTLSGSKIADSGFYFRTSDLRHQCVGYVTLTDFQRDSAGSYRIELLRIEEHGTKVTHVTSTASPELEDWQVWVASCDRIFRAVKLDDTVRQASAHMLMESRDGGETWHESHRFDGPVHLSFLTDSIWVAGSNRGRIWMTENGGATWELDRIEPAPVVSFGGTLPDYYPQFHRAILLDDSATVLILGDFGLLFRKDLEPETSGLVQAEEHPQAPGTLRVVPSVTGNEVALVWEERGPHEIRIVDVRGREVAGFTVDGTSSRMVVDLTTLVSGYYRVVLLTPAGEVVAAAPLLIRR